MWEQLLGLDFQRRRLLGRVAAGPLRDFLAVPFPDKGTDFREVSFVALDLETTGLDVKKDEILSIGLVELRNNRIDLATARHYLVTPSGAIPEASAVIHQITDDRAAEGRPLAEVMADVLPQLAGRVLIAHHARIERLFLKAACERLYGAGFLIPVADTEALVRQWLDRQQRHYKAGDLRLNALRQRYALPRYGAHNALSDALAAAELFVAYAAHRSLGAKAPLKLFLQPG